MFVESFVVVLECLVMRQVAWPCPGEYRTYQPRKGPANTASCLNVFCRALGLPVDHHQSKTIYVDADRQHVCSKHNVGRSCIAFFPTGHVFALFVIEFGPELNFQLIEIFWDVPA